MWRQGDVFVEVVHEIPAEAVQRTDLVLAEGEITGHTHRIRETDAATLYQHGDDRFLFVTADLATIVHEEHGPIALKSGLYRVWRQREYAPTALRTRHRYVRD